MAMLVRLNENLLAIRLGLAVENREPVLVAELFRGWEPIGNQVRMSLKRLGLREDSGLFDRDLLPPDRIWNLFNTASTRAEDGEVLWLQIADGAEVLAAYPWEMAFSTAAGRTIARVPNFVRDPFRREDERPFAICVAATDWDTTGLAQDRVAELLVALLETPIRNIALFVDPHWDGLEKLSTDFPQFDVWSFPLDVRIGKSPTRGDPWLAQIESVLGPKGARAVHFVCPCLASDLRGTIAFPEVLAEGKRFGAAARLVGAPEIAAFLDRLDCPVAGFSPLVPDPWDEGARLMVNELSWLRPGPIVASLGKGDVLGTIFAALFSHNELMPFPSPNAVLSVHPRTIGRFGGPVRTVSAVVNRELTLTEAETDEMTEVPQAELPRWLSRKVDQMSSARSKSPTQAARERGAMKAVDFVSQLVAGKEP